MHVKISFSLLFQALWLLPALGAPYQTRIFEAGTTFGAPEVHGTWALAPFVGTSPPDLTYIKTSDTGTGTVEVHVASGSSRYETRIQETGTTFAEEENGTWQLADFDGDGKLDLIYIKTSNTGTGYVEVHVASGSSEYQTRIIETATTFVEENNGQWQIIDFNGDGKLDLVYIKNQNTGTGYVEVHVASGASNFQTRIQEVPTTFTEENNGVWRLVNYQHSGHLDLAYIKDQNTGTNKVEVHIASGASTYQTRVQEVGTTFGEETDGAWQLIDWNGDGTLDLTFIKTSNTGTGDVEVHVASGAS